MKQMKNTYKMVLLDKLYHHTFAIEINSQSIAN